MPELKPELCTECQICMEILINYLGGLILSSRIEALAIFGLTLVCFGGVIMLFRDPIEIVTQRFWITSAFLDLMQIGWNAIGPIIFITGIISLMLAGIASRGSREVYVE